MNDDVSRAGRVQSISPSPAASAIRERVACFLHLRDLVYLHPGRRRRRAPFRSMQTLEARVIAREGRARKGVRRNARPGSAGWPTRYGGSTGDLAHNGGDRRHTDRSLYRQRARRSSWRRRSRSSSSRSRTVASGWARGVVRRSRPGGLQRLGRDKDPVAAGASAPRTNPRPSNTALET